MLKTNLMKIAEALVDTGIPCYHYFAPSERKAPYCVWAEASEGNSFEADNKKAYQRINGYVDYFTSFEFDENIDLIQEALNNIECCSWSLDSVLYGDPTHEDDNLIHYTWTWSL